MEQIIYSDIHSVFELLKNKKISSSELIRYIIDHIKSKDPLINACTTTCYDYAIEQAKECDKRIMNNSATPLTGIPVLIKDNICTKGIRTTCSSKILENFIPPYDATVINKLKQAGAVIIGKTNMDEFAMGSSTENSAFFVTKNPWNLNYVPGGSSGGSASAIAAHLAYYALGSDTGGSIRQPASFCNVVGLKPTYGLVSRYGLVAFASSLDQIGPITKTVRDCALVLTTIAGHDPNDATSVKSYNNYYVKLSIDNIKGLRIGVPKEYIGEGIQKEVQDKLIVALNQLKQLGAIIDFNLSLPNTKYALAAYYIIAPSEASANLARYDGFKYGFSYKDGASIWEVMEKTKQFGFGSEVKRRIMLGTFALSSGYYDAYYLKALKIRTLIKMEFEEAFRRYDVIITPTSPTLPFKIGEKIDDPMQMYMSDVCTVPVNIAGLPAISIPAGFVNGLPVGMQIIGKHFDEQTILNVAAAYESTVDWNRHLPPILIN